MRRAVPLHYSDYGYGNHPVKLAFQQTLYEWIPYFKECTLSWDQNQPGDDGRYATTDDSFSYHCGMGPMLADSVDIRRDDYDFTRMRRMRAIWRQASPLLVYGDYYPLTPWSNQAERWVVRQFDNPEHGEGFLQGIRLPACPHETITVLPQALRAETGYLFTNPETAETRRLSGTELARDGFTFTLPPRAAVPSGFTGGYREEEAWREFMHGVQTYGQRDSASAVSLTTNRLA